MSSIVQHPASFKDPSGFVFNYNNVFYRQVNKCYAQHYNQLLNSGLYKQLADSSKLISHEETDIIIAEPKEWFKTILPEQLNFISHPFEWSFDQLKDAALLTLQIQKDALLHGMILKDATPYNVQFNNGKAIWIDTLSFEIYNEYEPWVAYKQFCECFTGPLILAHYKKIEVHKLLNTYPRGIPLQLVAEFLPWYSKFNLNIYLHVYLHSQLQKTNSKKNNRKKKLGIKQLINITESLQQMIGSLKPKSYTSAWNNYYTETILSTSYFKSKEKIVENILQSIEVSNVLDLGANTGAFAKLIALKAKYVIATDYDANCINELYLSCKKNNVKNVLPLVIDIANPSAAIGWANKENESFLQRIHVDLIVALALIHHLVISNNISFQMFASLMSNKTKYLIIEFIPKTDKKIQEMLHERKDVFENYTQDEFEKVFSNYFSIQSSFVVSDSQRIIYLMKSHFMS